MPEYFTLDEFRTLPQVSNTSTYPAARVDLAAAYIVSIIEREVGTSFVPRTVTETYDGGFGSILLRAPYIRSVTSVTENGVAVTDTLTTVDGVLRRFAAGTYTPALSWATGVGNVSVTYQAGYSTTPPGDIKEAAMQATRWRLLATNSNAELSARQTSLTNDVGATIQFAVAGTDRPTGYPEVDTVIVGWRDRIRVPGVA